MKLLKYTLFILLGIICFILLKMTGQYIFMFAGTVCIAMPVCGLFNFGVKP